MWSVLSTQTNAWPPLYSTSQVSGPRAISSTRRTSRLPIRLTAWHPLSLFHCGYCSKLQHLSGLRPAAGPPQYVPPPASVLTFDLQMGSRVTFFHCQLAMPFRSRLRVRHGTDRQTDHGHQCIRRALWGRGDNNNQSFQPQTASAQYQIAFLPLVFVYSVTVYTAAVYVTSCRRAAATVCPRPSSPSVGAEAPSAAEHTAT